MTVDLVRAWHDDGGHLDPGPPAGLQWPGAGQHEGAVLRDLGLAGEVVKGQQGGRGWGWHLTRAPGDIRAWSLRLALTDVTDVGG